MFGAQHETPNRVSGDSDDIYPVRLYQECFQKTSRERLVVHHNHADQMKSPTGIGRGSPARAIAGRGAAAISGTANGMEIMTAVPLALPQSIDSAQSPP